MAFEPLLIYLLKCIFYHLLFVSSFPFFFSLFSFSLYLLLFFFEVPRNIPCVGAGIKTVNDTAAYRFADCLISNEAIKSFSVSFLHSFLLLPSIPLPFSISLPLASSSHIALTHYIYNSTQQSTSCSRVAWSPQESSHVKLKSFLQVLFMLKKILGQDHLKILSSYILFCLV